MKSFNQSILLGIAFYSFIFIMGQSCKKYPDPPPYFEVNTDTTKQSSRKVLLIAIDGAVGSIYKTIDPTVLAGLKTHSKFSYDAVSDISTTDAASWKTLISGVSYGNHKIKDSTFIYNMPFVDETSIPASYPSIFTYILTSAQASLKVTAISSWSTLLNRGMPEVADKILVADNAGVKDSAIARITHANEDFIITHFNSPAIAGRAAGFSALSPDYVTAVLKVDTYIGEIITALKARPQYNVSEEWLVVITGTHGGVNNTYGGSSPAETNVVSFTYNEKFKSTEIANEGIFSGVTMQGKDVPVKAQLLNDGGLYDPGTKQQTIQIKVNGTASYYPHFFSKMELWPSKPGWSMFTAGGNWAMSVRSATSGELRLQDNGGLSAFDNTWHTITIVFADSASKRWLRRYTDGTRIQQTDITALGDITSPSPITIGYGADPGQGASTFMPADLKIFNTALTDAEIANNLCLQDITAHPQYSSLAGYWPCNDGFGTAFKNTAAGAIGKDFTVQGPLSWDLPTDFPCNVNTTARPGVFGHIIKAVDFAAVAFYWLRINTVPDWNFEGNNWLVNFDSEFIQ